MKQPYTTTNTVLSTEVRQLFRSRLDRFAFVVATRRIEAGWSNRDLRPFRWRLAEEAASAAHEWIALTPDPAATVVELAHAEVWLWPRELFRAALRPVNQLIHRESRAVNNALLDFFGEVIEEQPDPLATTAEVLENIAARCATLRERANARIGSARGQLRRKYVRAFLRMLDRAEAYAVASVHSRTKPRSRALLFTNTRGTDWKNLPKWTVTGRNVCRISANLRALHLNRFIADLDREPPHAARQANEATFRQKLPRFASRVLRDWRRKGKESAGMSETAVAAACVWVANTPNAEESIAKLAEAAVNNWPPTMFAEARRAVLLAKRAESERASQITAEQARSYFAMQIAEADSRADAA